MRTAQTQRLLAVTTSAAPELGPITGAPRASTTQRAASGEPLVSPRIRHSIRVFASQVRDGAIMSTSELAERASVPPNERLIVRHDRSYDGRSATCRAPN